MLGFILILLSTVPELVLNLNKFLSALEMECWAGIESGSVVQQPGALTAEPRRILSNKI